MALCDAFCEAGLLVDFESPLQLPSRQLKLVNITLFIYIYILRGRIDILLVLGEASGVLGIGHHEQLQKTDPGGEHLLLVLLDPLFGPALDLAPNR